MKQNIYRRTSNYILLSDLKGFRKGKYLNPKVYGKTSYAHAREELVRRKKSGKIRKDAGISKPKQKFFGDGIIPQGFGTSAFGIRFPKPPKRRKGLFGFDY